MKLNKNKNKVVFGEAFDDTFDACRVLMVRDHVYMPRVGDMIQDLLVEAHGS